MIGLDCNILAQLAFADHPGNAKTLSAVQAETTKGERLVFLSLIIAQFLHVATDDLSFRKGHRPRRGKRERNERRCERANA
jgi:predicted nucleic acid-binding protein